MTKSIQQVASEARDSLMRYIRKNTVDSDAASEQTRDVRVKSVLDDLAREGKLPPKANAQPPVVAWMLGNDIQGNKHVLRVAQDAHAANTYDTEEIWIVQIDPPCPTGLRQIVLRTQPHTFGPWLSDDEVWVRDTDGQWILLNLAKTRGEKIGWGVPTHDGARFARVHGPGWSIATLEILDARTGAVQHTINTGQKLTPVAFDDAGRVLTCHDGEGTDERVVEIDVHGGSIISDSAVR